MPELSDAKRGAQDDLAAIKAEHEGHRGDSDGGCLLRGFGVVRYEHCYTWSLADRAERAERAGSYTNMVTLLDLAERERDEARDRAERAEREIARLIADVARDARKMHQTERELDETQAKIRAVEFLCLVADGHGLDNLDVDDIRAALTKSDV